MREGEGRDLLETLARTATLRTANSERVYLSNRQSMSIRVYLHTATKRTELKALLDSGATENFINHQYATNLRLPTKRLPTQRRVYNVDGTENKKGAILFYVDLEIRTGEKQTNMRFFLTELGPQQMILGYPWFAAVQPRIDWSKGWIDYEQLPVVAKTADAHQAPTRGDEEQPTNNLGTTVRQLKTKTKALLTRILKKTKKHPLRARHASQTKASQLAEQAQPKEKPQLPEEYRRHAKVFSEEQAQRFPNKRPWDHAIDLKPDAPASMPGKIYSLTQLEQKALQEFLEEHQKKGYI
jgi:hypothetical protein